jgi:hypothetical protein
MNKIELSFGRILYGLLMPTSLLLIYFFVKYILKSEYAFEVLVIVFFISFIPSLILVISYVVHDRRTRIEYDKEFLIITIGSKVFDYKINDLKEITRVSTFLYHILASEHSYYILSFKDGQEVKVSYLLGRSLVFKDIPYRVHRVAYPMLMTSNGIQDLPNKSGF